CSTHCTKSPKPTAAERRNADCWRETLSERLRRLPRRTRQTAKRFWRDFLPVGPAISSCRDKVFGSGSVFGCKAWNPQNGHGSTGIDVLGPTALVTRRVRQPSP